MDRDPTEKMRAPTVPESPVPIVSAADFKKLLETASGKDFTSRRDTAVLLMLYDTGMRAGELIGLTLEDVDLRGRLAYVTGKGDRLRAVRFGAATAVALDRYLRLRRGHRYADSAWFWLGQRGRLEYSALAVMLAKRSEAAGLPRIHAHQMRHSFAHDISGRRRERDGPTAARRVAQPDHAATLRREHGRRASAQGVQESGRSAMTAEIAALSRTYNHAPTLIDQ